MRRAASAAPPPGPMGPLPPRPAATPAGWLRAPGSGSGRYRRSSPAGVPIPRSGGPARSPRPAAQRGSPCSRSPPRGPFQGFPLRSSASSPARGLCPRSPVWVLASRPFACAPRSAALRAPLFLRLRGSARTLPVAPAPPGFALRPLDSRWLPPGLAAPLSPCPPGLPARWSRAPAGAARALPRPGPPPPPCEHAPGRWAPWLPGDGTGRQGTGRDEKGRSSGRSRLPAPSLAPKPSHPRKSSVPSPALCGGFAQHERRARSHGGERGNAPQYPRGKRSCPGRVRTELGRPLAGRERGSKVAVWGAGRAGCLPQGWQTECASVFVPIRDG